MIDSTKTIKLDLHVHSQERSACAKSSAEEMISAAIERGLDGLVFTDHDRLMPPQRVADLQEAYAPLAIYGGIELTVGVEHVLVLGVNDPGLETREWSYRELYTFARDRGGYLVLAHPFRYRDTIDIDIEVYTPDAIELHSKNIRAGDEDRIRALADKLSVQLVCNSDAHLAADVGCYYNTLETNGHAGANLVELLRAQPCRCDGTTPLTCSI